MTQIAEPTPAEPRFGSGDPVVHPSQGAGTIERIVTLDYTGTPLRYYSIELVDSDSTLILPVEKAEELGLRHADFGLDDIEAALDDEPRELPDSYRSRQAQMRSLLNTGKPIDLARIVRDMAWRGRQPDTNLTKVDKDLLRDAKHMLATELAARLGTTVDAATRRIEETVGRVMDRHAQANGSPSDA